MVKSLKGNKRLRQVLGACAGVIVFGFATSAQATGVLDRVLGNVHDNVNSNLRKPVDESKSAAPKGYVHIKVLRGYLKVNGWDKDEIHVSGLLDEELKEFVFKVDGKDARIQVKIPSKSDGWSSEGSDLEIHVPEGSELEITSISTEIGVDNIQNGLEIGNVSGEIRVSDIGGRVEISTVSGDVDVRSAKDKVRIGAVSGDIEVSQVGSGRFGTVSGDLRLIEVGEELDLETISGDIEVDTGDIVQLSGQSVSGDVEITGVLKAEGVIDFDNVSGSIRMQLPLDTNARFDVETGSGGNIRNRLSDDEPKVSKYVRNESLRFSMGDGKGQVNLSTASGDITLAK